MGEKKIFTCPNAACNRSFAEPIKTLNLQETPPEPYFACPFCLTKIEAPELQKQDRRSEAQPVKPAEEKRKEATQGAKPVGCGHHLGYLSERGQKEIPDGCLVCTDIVACMLKRMRDS
ncbi:MAG TPA: hypothetical protein VLH35_07125 [Candidatus Acidoferrales bacterium]|nr:hypothetical protein [Candidatus Acidoferrales bacterium]